MTKSSGCQDSQTENDALRAECDRLVQVAKEAYSEGFIHGNAGRNWSMIKFWANSKTKAALDGLKPTQP